MANDTINNDSDSGIYAIIAAAAIIGFIFVKFVTPLIIELNKFYNSLILTLTNKFVMILILIIVLSILFFLIFYKVLKKVYERKTQRERQREREERKHENEERKRYLKEEIDNLQRHKKFKEARELSRELRYMEGDFSDEGEGIEYVSLMKKDDREERRKQEEEKEQENIEEGYPDEDEEEKESEDEKIERDYQNRKKYKININVDFHKIFYKKKELNKYEIKYLLKSGYFAFKYKSIVTDKNETFIIKPRHNESLKHMVVVYDIKDYLDQREINSEIYTTRMPDNVIFLSKKKVALEVETGTVLTNMKKFREKLNLLNTKYGKDWYFIVTDRKLIKKYRKFGKVIDPRFIKFNLNKIIKNA